MPFSVQFIRKLEGIEPGLREILLALLEEVERQREESVTRKEFLEFARQTEESLQQAWQAIKELAEAQRKTEQRLNELAEAQRRTEQRLDEFQRKTEENFQKVWQAIKELAEAQKKTEQRLNELAEAQKKTEQRLNELAEAQKKTEQRLNELAEAQKKTEQRLNELAEAQKKTEEEIRKLSIGLKRTREEVGGLSRSVAYALENEAYRRLPDFLKKNYGIEITEKFIRTEIKDEEINLFARGRRDGQEVVIVGESVLKLDDVKKVKAVLRKADLVVDEVEGEVVPIIVTHFAKKKVLEGARKRGIIVVQSFEW